MLIAQAATALMSTVLGAFNIGMISTPAETPVAPADQVRSACSFEVIGHRGTDTGVARDNTVAAFRKAVAAGADLVELDIHRTAPDDQGHRTWVISHDPTIRGRQISTTTYRTLKNWQPDLATFDQAAQLVAAAGVGIEVEVKPDRVSAAGLADALGILTRHQLRGSAVVTSAHRSVLAQLKPIAGPTQLGVIARDATDPKSLKKIADRVLISHSVITTDWVAAAHAQNLRVEVWTVDDVVGWQKFDRYDVDGIITDKAGAVNRWCAGEHLRSAK